MQSVHLDLYHPELYLGVICLSSNFSPIALQIAKINTFEKIQDGHHSSKIAARNRSVSNTLFLLELV